MNELTPVQRKILSELFSLEASRPTYEPGIADRLRAGLEESLRADVEGMGTAVVVGKYDLDLIHRCEGRWVASKAREFAWTINMIRGRVAHTAIEVALLSRDAPHPLDLVDRAVDRLAAGSEQDSVAQFLGGLDPIDMARLKGEANNAVAGFVSDWPPIDRAWTPRAEARVRARIFGGRVALGAKYDLAFGRAKGMQARVIIVDFKTGRRRAGDIDDLRYYALVETIKTGVPPFRVASYYLEESDFHAEDVTEELLETAVRRTADGVRRIAALQTREPTLNPGPQCEWCPQNRTCEPGIKWLATERASSDDPAEDD